MDIIEESASEAFEMHSSLLSKGFALERPPNVQQALDGVIPFSFNSNERLFLRNFVTCTPGTSGGRLARWLQPESFVDVDQCEVLFKVEYTSTSKLLFRPSRLSVHMFMRACVRHKIFFFA